MAVMRKTIPIPGNRLQYLCTKMCTRQKKNMYGSTREYIILCINNIIILYILTGSIIYVVRGA